MSTTIENLPTETMADEAETAAPAPLDDWTLLREVIWPKRETPIKN